MSGARQTKAAIDRLGKIQMPSGGEPNRWTVRHFADVGSSEPFVTRITFGLSDVLDATLYENAQQIKEAIMGLSLECLMPAFTSLRELRKIADDNSTPMLNKFKNFDDMYKYLWTAYKDRMQIVAKLMGYDIGFLFQKDALFEKGCEEFLRANPGVRAELIAGMRAIRATWQPGLMRFRNEYLEHQTIRREDVSEFYLLEWAEAAFHTVWTTIEEILVLLMEAKLPKSIRLREIPEAERDPGLPRRFGFSWAAGQPRGQL